MDREQVVIGEEIGNVRLITLNRPRQLNGINSGLVYLLSQFLERWEKDDDAKLVIIKGAGRAFCAGGDLKMFYDGKSEKDCCLEVVYRMYWLCYHIHTYKKPTISDGNLCRLSTINKCFSAETVEEITKLFVREGRKQSLPECLRKEFRLTINLLRSVISDDVYEGIRALIVDKDNDPKWTPSSLGQVSNEKINLVFEPLGEKLDLQIPMDEVCRWNGKYENSVYPEMKTSKSPMEPEKKNGLI